VLIGPESSGKTTLAQQLAQHFNTVWCPEYLRTYLDTRVYVGGVETGDFSLEPSDLLALVVGQIAAEKALEAQVRDYMFLDTTVLTLQIYWNLYFGFSPQWLNQLIDRHRYDLYLLTHPDTPWVADGMRDLPLRRKEVFELFRTELQRRNLQFIEIEGLGEQRLINALNSIKEFEQRSRLNS
jgi:NadR type nicotinamide-nucleotide adenylyltransferase